MMRRLVAFACAVHASAVLLIAPAAADVISDEAAAVLIFPRVLAENARERGRVAIAPTLFATDTVIQISNVSTAVVNLHCFYVSANGHCSINGSACLPGDTDDFSCPSPTDLCLPGWTETDFQVSLTPRQPLAWRASVGLSRDLLPLDGASLRGPDGSSNTGTLVPPVHIEEVSYVPPDPPQIKEREFFAGELKCVVVDPSGRAIAANVVKGEATVISQAEFGFGLSNFFSPRAEKYNAIGVQAIEGDANGDGVLELGGGSNEYNGCAQVLIAEHLFDLASYNVELQSSTEFTLVPCTQDLRSQTPGSTVAQFLVFNEFEQRFSTSRTVDCLFKRSITQIDTPDRERSIFLAQVAGSFAGQTRIRGVQTGLLGVISESAFPEFAPFSGDASFHFAMQGERAAADRITLP